MIRKLEAAATEVAEKWDSKISCDGKVLTNALKMVLSVNDEAPIKVTKDGIRIKVLSLSETSLINIEIPFNVFEHYEVDNEGAYGVYVEDLLKILKTTKDVVTLKFAKDKLIIETGISSACIPTFEAEKEPPDPIILFSASFITETALLKKILGALKGKTDAIKLYAENEKVKILVSEDSFSFEAELKTQDQEIKEKTVATYGLRDLYKFLSAVKEKNISVAYGNDIPIKISGNGHFTYKYYLAPNRFE